MKRYYLYLLVSVLFIFTSCVSKKKMVYLQGEQNTSTSSINYDPLIQRDDRLNISISSLEHEATKPFNINGNSYLVDINGNIEFPVIGTIKVEGYSIENLKALLKERLIIYLKNPVVNISIENFKVTVLGDVGAPGIKSFTNHRVTLFDVIAASGDISIYGKRTNILIIRDYQGIKSFNKVDITKADFVNSPFYYLDQNDIVYVEQRKAKMDATALPNLPLIISVISFLTTIIILLK